MKRGFITIILLLIMINCVQAIFFSSKKVFDISNHLKIEINLHHKGGFVRAVEKEEIDQLGNQKKVKHHKLHKRHKKLEMETKTYEENNEISSLSYEPNISVEMSLLPQENWRIRETPVTHVMLHFMSNGAVNPKAPYNVQELHDIFVEYGLSTHYLIDRSGKIYQPVEEHHVAYHAGKGSLPHFPQYTDKLNDYSIGIEIMAIGTKDEMESMIASDVYESIDQDDIGYKDEQYEALNMLLNDINERHPAVLKSRDHIIGHDEYAPNRKTDPGSLFDWSKIDF